MFKRIYSWIEERTEFDDSLRSALDTEVAGGATWWGAFGSAMIALLVVQAISGALMMMTYVPDPSSAWSSVYYITHRVTGGWFIRGIHWYGASALMLVAGLHLFFQVLVGAYKRPREVHYWLGLGLLGLLQLAAISGYLLPWDLKGYWAIRVESNIIGGVPVVGNFLRTLLIGESEYGHSTLTRLYAIHVAIVPALLFAIVAWRYEITKRVGAAGGVRTSERYWPRQALRDVLVAVVVLLIVAVVTAVTHGPTLEAPADPAVDYSARPAWFFLFLYKMRDLFPASLEVVPTVILPGAVATFLFMLPMLDRSEDRSIKSRLFIILPLIIGFVSLVGLNVWAAADDRMDAHHQASIAKARIRADRAIALADQGIPQAGPLAMLRDDPLTRGSDVYERMCLSCHVLDGMGERKAPDHTGFGSREWLIALINTPDADHFFGRTELDGMDSMSSIGEEGIAAVAEYMFAMGREPQDPAVDEALAARGEPTFRRKCVRCHTFEGGGDAMGEGGPDLTGYGSRTWILKQIATPEAIYPVGNEMPGFEDQLDEHDLRMVTAYLRQQRFAEATFPEMPPIETTSATAE